MLSGLFSDVPLDDARECMEVIGEESWPEVCAKCGIQAYTGGFCLFACEMVESQCPYAGVKGIGPAEEF